MHESPDPATRLFAREINNGREAVAQLLAMARNIVADGRLDDLELEFLRAWLAAHSDIAGFEAGGTISRAIEAMLADAHASELERDYLIATLQQLSSRDS